MAGFGPAPKPEGQRRNHSRALADQAGKRLPAEGRQGDAPVWPLLAKATQRQAALWNKLWHTSQAIMWEQLGWLDTVALYTRIVAMTESGKPKLGLLMERRQLEDRLGLTPMSMLRLRWTIEVPLISDAEPDKMLDIRDRLQAND